MGPFAKGYFENENDSTVKKIARGLLRFAEELPIDIDPEIGLARIHRGANNIVEPLDMRLDCGNGVVVQGEINGVRSTGYYFEASKTENEKKLCLNKTLWGGGWGGHANPDYGTLIRIGTDGYREQIAKYRKVNDADDFYDAMLMTLDALDIIAERFRKLAVEAAETATGDDLIKYNRIAEALAVVPKKPAYDFFSAIQSFYLVFSFDGKDSPGLFDVYMSDYYKIGDREENKNILRGLWKGFYQTRAWNLCLSGSDENWNDLSSELTYDILDIVGEMKVHTPNVTMRVHRNTPEWVWKKAAEVIGKGCGMPALYNDEVVCPALEALGIPPCDSHLYAMNGCNQIDIQGKSHMGLEDGEICLAKCLEYAITNGECLYFNEKVSIETGDPCNCETFEEFFDLYKKQVENAVEITVSLSNRSQEMQATYSPNPLRSILIQGCIEKGKNYRSGGPLYNHGQILTEGLADAIDSLASIKHFVFDTKEVTMAELVDAIKTDYKGRDDLYLKFRKYPAKFGNDEPETNKLAKDVLDHYFGYLANFRTFRDPVNGIFGGGLSTFVRTGEYGRKLSATANGRHAFDIYLADSIGAVPGFDKNGPTSVIKSCMNYDQTLAKSGFVLQLKFDSKLFNTEKGYESFIALAKAYFENGGQQLSINVTSAEDLLKAKKNPESYKSLMVRVGGFSAPFVDLDPDLQDNIIARTLHNV